MVVGTTLLKLDGSAYYSPQFRRGGLGATFSCDVLVVQSGTTLDFDITVQSKNADETSWGDVASFSTINSAGVYTVSAGSIKEQVRFKYTLSGAGTAAYDAVHFNMLAPSWRPY